MDMDSNYPVQSCSAGSVRGNPITIDEDSECDSPVKISKRTDYTTSTWFRVLLVEAR